MKKHILVAPLDWGLGHATRCIPLINYLLEKGVQVSLGASGDSLQLLQETYPEVHSLRLPAYDVSYTKSSWQIAKIARQIPRLQKVIQEEHRLLKAWVKKQPLSAIISDNRYGCWHKDIPSVFLCHQLSPRLPQHLARLHPLLARIHSRFLTPFQEIWVPDYPGETSLSGSLSQAYKALPKVRYLGPLSRFWGFQPSQEGFSWPQHAEEKPFLLAVLSGPEPQRSLLEERILTQVQQIKQTCWLVQGKWANTSIRRVGNCVIFPHMLEEDLYIAYRQAEWVLSRSGYSSLMDFATLGLKKVILVPTPGQTEQEYLARQLEQKERALVVMQKELTFDKILQRSLLPKGFEAPSGPPAFEPLMDDWLWRISN